MFYSRFSNLVRSLLTFPDAFFLSDLLDFQTFQGCESDTSLKNKFEIEMHMETYDQSGIPPVTLQRNGYRPLHLYLIFLLVCVHDHSPYNQSDVTILKQASFIILFVC